MVGAILVPIALGIGAAFVVPWIQTLVASDRCLDAGGSYDYKTEICIGTPSVERPLSGRSIGEGEWQQWVDSTSRRVKQADVESDATR